MSANEVAKGNVFTPVCQSFCSLRGVSASVYAGMHTDLEQTPPGADTPLAQYMLGDTGNKRAVRILLECILVVNRFLMNSYLIINGTHCLLFQCKGSFCIGAKAKATNIQEKENVFAFDFIQCKLTLTKTSQGEKLHKCFAYEVAD